MATNNRVRIYKILISCSQICFNYSAFQSCNYEHIQQGLFLKCIVHTKLDIHVYEYKIKYLFLIFCCFSLCIFHHSIQVSSLCQHLFSVFLSSQFLFFSFFFSLPLIYIYYMNKTHLIALLHNYFAFFKVRQCYHHIKQFFKQYQDDQNQESMNSYMGTDQ